MVPFELFDQPWILFRDEHGDAAVIQDECAHRACPLSVGSISNGHAVCAYHGAIPIASAGTVLQGCCPLLCPLGVISNRLDCPPWQQTAEARRCLTNVACCQLRFPPAPDPPFLTRHLLPRRLGAQRQGRGDVHAVHQPVPQRGGQGAAHRGEARLRVGLDRCATSVRCVLNLASTCMAGQRLLGRSPFGCSCIGCCVGDTCSALHCWVGPPTRRAPPL